MTTTTAPNVRVANRRTGALGDYVGRPTPLGNPFEIGKHGTREEVIAKYSEWLDLQMQDYQPNAQQAMIAALVNKARRHGQLTLVCWCAPQPCHADVIRDVILDHWRFTHVD